MLFFMRAARPHRARETFDLIDAKTVTYCLSPAVLAEIQDVLTRPRHQRQFPQLTPERVAEFLEEITRRSCLVEDVPEVYRLDRDPKDSKYVNLAIATAAPYLVTRDKDLLELMDATLPEGRDFRLRFPDLRILTPADFVQEIAKSGH